MCIRDSCDSAVPTAVRSGPNSVDSAGCGTPLSSALTSRSTPTSCSSISHALWNLSAGFAAVALRSSRVNDGCPQSAGSGLATPPEAGLNPGIASTASVLATV